MDIFLGRDLVIATKHKKESVIAPRVADKLGVIPFVPKEFDTDQFGTFSGEIKRTLDPLTAARRKCELAMEITGVDLAMASEGSFNMHPAYFFIPANEEIVMLLDKKNGLEIVGKKLSTETNFDRQMCYSEEELFAFASKVLFPTHGLILRDNVDSDHMIFKGICEREELKNKFQLLSKLYGQALAETDMRAQYNPMRMNVIAQATDAMLAKASVLCEQCNTPGFGIIDVRAGLECKLCNMPTSSTKVYVHACLNCGFSKEQLNPHKSYEDPMYCNFCNP